MENISIDKRFIYVFLDLDQSFNNLGNIRNKIPYLANAGILNTDNENSYVDSYKTLCTTDDNDFIISAYFLSYLMSEKLINDFFQLKYIFVIIYCDEFNIPTEVRGMQNVKSISKIKTDSFSIVSFSLNNFLVYDFVNDISHISNSLTTLKLYKNKSLCPLAAGTFFESTDKDTANEVSSIIESLDSNALNKIESAKLAFTDSDLFFGTDLNAIDKKSTDEINRTIMDLFNF